MGRRCEVARAVLSAARSASGSVSYNVNKLLPLPLIRTGRSSNSCACRCRFRSSGCRSYAGVSRSFASRGKRSSAESFAHSFHGGCDDQSSFASPLVNFVKPSIHTRRQRLNARQYQQARSARRRIDGLHHLAAAGAYAAGSVQEERHIAAKLCGQPVQTRRPANRHPRASFSPSNVRAASELPPPSPPPAGMRFSSDMADTAPSGHPRPHPRQGIGTVVADALRRGGDVSPRSPFSRASSSAARTTRFRPSVGIAGSSQCSETHQSSA